MAEVYVKRECSGGLRSIAQHKGHLRGAARSQEEVELGMGRVEGQSEKDTGEIKPETLSLPQA